jgi:outer membrane immunogenic protein
LVLSHKLGHRDGRAVRSPEVATPGWTGFYVGAGIGAGAEAQETTFVAAGVAVDAGGEGGFGTVVLGYDRVLWPGWVAGVFGDFDFSAISGDSVSDSGTFSRDHDYSWSVGARLGTLVNPATLLYGTAGYTRAQFAISGALSDSNTFDGYFVGAGMETFLRENWTFKLEYRFSDFGDNGLLEPVFSFDPSLHTARLVLSYKFGPRD